MTTQVELRGKRIVQEYQIPATTSATAARALTFPTTNQSLQNGQQEVIIIALGAAITFLFGNSAVSASTTSTDDALPAGNFTLLSGAIYAISLLPTQNNVSVKTATGSGTAIIQLTTPIV